MKNQKKIKEKLENSLSYKANIEDFSCNQKNYNDEIIDDLIFEESFLLEVYKRNMGLKKSSNK